MNRVSLVVFLTACLLCFGCSAGGAMSRADLEDYVQQELDGEPEFGDVESVSCDQGLAETVGASADCFVTGSAVAEAPVTARVDSIDDGRLDVALEFVTLS